MSSWLINLIYFNFFYHNEERKKIVCVSTNMEKGPLFLEKSRDDQDYLLARIILTPRSGR